MKSTFSQLLENHGFNPDICELSAPENWLKLSESLDSTIPFEIHQELYDACFQESITAGQLPVAWRPSPDEIAQTNLGRWMTELELNEYQQFFRYSVDSYPEFWKRAIEKLNIPFKQPYEKIIDLSEGEESPKWLPGAKLNIVDACFTADADQTAITYRDLTSQTIHQLSYADLERRVNQVACSLVASGFAKGDAIAIDMLMTLESVIVYLGIVKAGMVAVSIADSFAPEEIATRLRISNSRAVFTQDHILRGEKKLPMYEKVSSAIEKLGEIKIIVIPAQGNVQQPPQIELRSQDSSWGDFLVENFEFNSVECAPDDATNILFSSGTTGDPKAIPWTHTTPMKSAMDGMLHHDIRHRDVVAWPTNLGWMMGPWLIYAALINRASIALCYPPPMTEEFGQFVQDARVTMLGIVPSIVKSWRSTGIMSQYDWSNIRCFSSTGEVSNPQDYLFLMSLAGYKPVIEYCGGTEIGGGYVTGTMVQDASPSTFTTPALGLDFVVLDENSKATDEGELYLTTPSIGLSTRLLNKDHTKVYFENTPVIQGKTLRRHGDQILRLSNGYFRAQGRADDTMNLGGIKTSSAEIERTCNKAENVVETAAIAVPPAEGGPDRLVIFAVANTTSIEKLITEFQQLIKAELNPLFKVHDVVICDKLPRTASNKVMRRVLRQQYKSV